MLYLGLIITLAAAIANALAGNTSLTKLSLRGNYLHEPSGAAFANAMQHNSTIRKLDLEANQLSHTVFKACAI